MSPNIRSKIVLFHHNDLDGFGCKLNIHHKFSEVADIEYFTTNYRNLSSRVDEIVEFCHRNSPKTIFICDICFTNNLADLERIAELGIKIIYIDHHLYSDEFHKYFLFKENKFNISFVLDTNKSATLLTSEFLKNTDVNLLNITKLINQFDIWLSTEKEFLISLHLNNYFWNKFKNRQDIFSELISSNYILGQEFVDFLKQDKTNCKKHIDDLLLRKLIYKQKDTYIIFSDDYYQNFVFEKFKEHDIECVIIVNSFGSIKVRFKHSFNSKTKEFIKKELIGNIQGHENAFSYGCKPGLENIMLEVRKIYEVINS